MPDLPPKVLFFDVMSTLVYDPIAREIPEFFGLSLEQLYENRHPTAWLDFERGEISESLFYERYFPQRGEPIEGSALRATLYDAYRFLDGVQPLLARLAEGPWSIHALSNYPVWFEIIEDKLELSRYLQWSFVSCKTGVRKPQETAYTGAARSLSVAPAHCLFIDDRKINCEAARQVGMDAVRFENSSQLEEELRGRGIVR